MMNMLSNLEVLESLGAVGELTGKRIKVRIIEGDKLGSSAYYPADVVRRDGPKIFTKGTPMFIDHQTADEKANKPFGSVGTFAAELAEDAYYENDGLYADVEVFEDMAPFIKARAGRIGISVRGNVVAEEGIINGKRVPIAKQFTSAKSVDFVMRPGAGGKVVSILESAVEELQDTVAEESGENMDEVLAELKALKDSVDTRFTAIEEQLKEKPAVIEEAAVVEVDADAKALEIAEAFVNSTLDAAGRKRVLALHKADGTPIAELIVAEEAYLKDHGKTEAEVEGIEESAVEESAKTTISVPTPGAWLKKDK